MHLHRLLGRPWLYSTFAAMVGGNSREIYVREHVRAKSGDRILDIGCGPGDILASLPLDIRYTGFDANASYIEAARSRFGEHGQFICQHVNPALLQQFTNFDLVMANGVLHHLDDQEAKTLLEIARSALKHTGRLVTLDGCYVDGQSAVARYLLRRDRGSFVRNRVAYTALAESVFTSVTAHIRHDLMRIPYTHIIMECQL